MKGRLLVLTESIANQQEKIASLSDERFEKVPTNQKMIVQVIVSAAKKVDPRGRRYTDEFIMLCTLMNIRSKRNYEFLRRNDIILLPCTKTIRDYMSLMGSKCGFDEGFSNY